jgi:hypothetical protein
LKTRIRTQENAALTRSGTELDSKFLQGLLREPLKSCESLLLDLEPTPAIPVGVLLRDSLACTHSQKGRYLSPRWAAMNVHHCGMAAYEMNALTEPSSLNGAHEFAHLLRINVLLTAVLREHAHDGLSVTTLRLQDLQVCILTVAHPRKAVVCHGNGRH